jgi:ABC-type multidrug transport system ATPase subunit
VSLLELRGLWSPPLKNLSATFGAGVHVVLGGEGDGSAELIELCAGVRRPRRGSILLDGAAPSDSPDARRRIGSLLPLEDWQTAGDVRRWAGEIGALHGFDLSAALQQSWPDLALGREVGTLSSATRRELSLAAALALPEPQLVALHEPLGSSAAARERVLARIVVLAEHCPVVITTSSVADARRLGGQLSVLERGVLVRSPESPWPDAVTPGLRVELWVETDAPRRLLAELATTEDVEGVQFDAQLGDRLRLAGSDLERLSVAVARAAERAQVQLHSLGIEAPDLHAVHGASAGLAEAAYRAAQSSRRSPPVLGPRRTQ